MNLVCSRNGNTAVAGAREGGNRGRSQITSDLRSQCDGSGFITCAMKNC